MPALASKTLSVMRRLSETLAAMRSYWPQSRRPAARIAINMAPRKSPYGGGNQFVAQLTRCLRFFGYEVVFHLDRTVDCIVLVDGRAALTTFGIAEIAAWKKRYPSVVCIHRINECDQRKGSDFMDALLAQANEVADYSVFISRWLRDYHATRWFDIAKPHTVIHNGADPGIFHPLGSHAPSIDDVFRLVTHHWSDNPMKGFDVYAQVDAAIADGYLPDTELWVIGRWPASIRWRAARLFPPLTGSQLADQLRQCHGYVTGSRWEPGGMHFIEGAQCGLPVLFHTDGGGIVEVAERFGIGFRDDLMGAVKTMRSRYRDLRGEVLDHGPSGDHMCTAYRQLIQTLLVADGRIG